MTAKNYSMIGTGVVHVRKRAANEGFRDVGNVSALNISAEEEERTLRNYRGGGGNYAADRQVSGVTAEITLHDFSPENWEMALRGTVTEVSAGSVTGEEHTVYVGAMTPLDYVPDWSDTANTLTVTKDPGGTATVLTEGTDYETTPTGIRPLEGGAVQDGDTVGVDYDKHKSAIIHALMGASPELEIYFEGLNDAQGGMPVRPHLKRVKLGVPSDLGFISEDFASMSITADVLYANDAAAGTSPFFDINMQRKA
ncbi:hypothetical protein [Arhodomonas sp. AD133]|uniref:phage tail tube protein n=1 Tax=Arhodomonas sp. AD133 TaxID=3415009 RepID=UPI003EB7588A